MSWMFASALRLSEAEIVLQYQKLALVILCAALPLRACIAVWFDHRNWSVLLPSAVWLAFLTGFLLMAVSSGSLFGLIAAAGGLAIAWIPVPRRWLTDGAIALQLPGIIAAVGAVSLAIVGALP